MTAEPGGETIALRTISFGYILLFSDLGRKGGKSSQMSVVNTFAFRSVRRQALLSVAPVLSTHTKTLSASPSFITFLGFLDRNPKRRDFVATASG